MDMSAIKVRQFRVELVKKWIKMELKDNELIDLCLSNFCCSVQKAQDYVRTAKAMLK